MVSFTAEREPLLALADRVLRVTDFKSKIPILGHFLIEADLGGAVTITGTTLDMAASGSAPADVSAAGIICIPGNIFTQSLRRSRGSEVRVEPQVNVMKVIIGKSRFTIPTLPASDFPGLPMVSKEPTHSFEVASGFLRALERQVGYAIDAKDHRFYLHGISMAEVDGKLSCIAGSTPGLSLWETNLPDGAGGMPSIIIPAEMVEELSTVDTGKPVQVEIGEGFARVRSGFTLASKLIEARYPPARSAIPAAHPKRVRLDRAELIHAIKRVALFADERDRSIRLSFSPDTLTLSGVSGPTGSAVTEMATECDLTFEIGFAAKPLTASLESFGSEIVEMAFNGGMDPAVITDPADATRTVVAMPYALRVEIGEAEAA